MKKLYAVCFALIFSFLGVYQLGLFAPLNAQTSFNMTLLGQWDDPSIPLASGAQYNDVYGYAQGGREYAIVGASTANYVIEVTNPATPVVRAILNSSCASTVWRDHAIYQNYLYVITDGCISGLQVWDLSPLPAAPVQVFNSTMFFNSAHTLFLNPGSGRLYVGGANTQVNGVLVLELLGHPATPTLYADFTLGAYTHDMYVHNDTLYAFQGSGGVSSFDLTDVNIAYGMGLLWTYPEQGYAHSGWGINGNKNLVFSDETAGKSLKVANIADPWDITFQTLFKSALLAPTYTNSIAHNPIGKGNLIYVSYYEDGLQVWDVSTPTAPVRVAYYDTQSNVSYNGMKGAWGVYPFLPSGRILVSDMVNGLFILQQNTPFPVTFSNFEAIALQGKVKLGWSTETELNNLGFMVERSTDGEHFEDLKQVPGAGVSNSHLDYITYDESPKEGVSYYRLRQMDVDGNFTLSSVVSVDFNNAAPEMTVFPSPAHAGELVSIQFNVQEPGNGTLSVYDMVGKLLFEKAMDLNPGRVEVTLPCSQWASGTYLLRLEGEKYRMEQKLLLAQ